MIESLLMGRRALDPNVLIDIDFNRQSVGDTDIVDLGGNTWNRVAGSGTNPVVVSDATMGNVMQFNGSGYFTLPMVNRLRLSAKSFLLEIVLKCTNDYSKVFGTGDYPSPSGFVVSVNQYPATYIQMFLEISGTTYYRVLPSLTNNGGWATAQFRRTYGVNVVGTIFRDGAQVASYTQAQQGFGDGGPLCIGTTPGSPGTQLFKGSIKSIKLTLI